ncbi:MAG TPA: UvrD-helicase domain-containing protein [Clostridiaceae bacterium]
MGKLELVDAKVREKIEKSLHMNFLVEAGAGSGKTTCLVKRIISEIASGNGKIQEIVAITFTKKAADELKQRFQNKLEATILETEEAVILMRLNTALSNIDSCFIGTIHSFCSRILRERPIEAMLNPDFEEVDDLASSILLEEAWHGYLEHVRVNNPELLKSLDIIGIKPEELKQCFIQISTYPDINIEGIEIKKPEFRPYYEKLKNLLRDAMDYIPKVAPDNGFDELQKSILAASRNSKYLDMEDERNLINILASFNKLPKVTLNRWADKKIAKEFKEEFTIFRDEIESDMRKWKEYSYYYVLNFVKPGVKYYEELRYKRSLLNFQDLLMKTAEVLKNYGEVRKYFQSKYKFLLVDEYQDTDPIQAEIIFYLTGEDTQEKDFQKLKPRPGSLFVVGDPKQSIYRFRRADIYIYNLTKALIEKSGGETLSLVSNFRSVKSICNVLNKTYKETFPEEFNDYQAKYSMLEGVREDAVGSDFGLRILKVGADFTNKDEIIAEDAKSIGKYIAWAIKGNVKLSRSEDEIKEGLSPTPIPKDFLIILRYKDQMEVYSRALESMGIKTVIAGSSSFGVYPEMKELLKVLRALTDIYNEVYLIAVLRGMFFGISDDILYKFKKSGGRFSIFSEVPEDTPEDTKNAMENAYAKLKKYYSYTKELTPAVVISKIISECGIVPFILTEEMKDIRNGNVYQMLEIIRGYELEGLLDFKQMVTKIEELFTSKLENEISLTGDNNNGVRIMNLHKVKGLEAPIVFLANPYKLTGARVDIHIERKGEKPEGYLAIKKVKGYQVEIIAEPDRWEGFEEEEKKYLVAEEERLLYVAGTRAKNILIISSSEKTNGKNPWSKILNNIPEEFIIDIDKIEMEEKIDTYFQPANFLAEKTKINSIDDKIFSPSFNEITPSVVSTEGETLKVHFGESLGAEFGVVMHKLYQLLVENNQVTEIDILTALKENEVSEGKILTVRKLLKDFKDSNIFKRIKKSKKVLCEIPFSLKINSDESVPSIVFGIMDLVFKEEGGWVILDYKTNAAEREEALEGLTKHYSNQLKLYRAAFEKISGEKVKSCVLCFVRGVNEEGMGIELIEVN